MKYAKQKILYYLDSLYDKQEGSFRFSRFSESTILSTDFAVSTLNLLGEDAAIQSKKDKAIDYLKKSIGEDLLIVDRKFDLHDTPGIHKEDYITFQSTYFTLIAADILGMQFNELPFFEKFLDKDNLVKWFTELDWGKFWYESNKIMFVMYFFSYIIKFGREDKKIKAKDQIELCFEILNGRQDKNTGYWGTEFNNNDLYDGAYGAAHIFLFYDYFGKEIRYKEKIIDSTLKLHFGNGLSGREGGACEDYDLIEIYLRTLKQTGYRKDEIIFNLKKMRGIMINFQHKDGGFPYKFYKAKSIIHRIFGKAPRDIKYKYSSWNKMETLVYESDLWGTYFRVLSLTVLDLLIDDKDNYNYNSYHLPGWGYLNRQI
jgi:hypothetical protein